MKKIIITTLLIIVLSVVPAYADVTLQAPGESYHGAPQTFSPHAELVPQLNEAEAAANGMVQAAEDYEAELDSYGETRASLVRFALSLKGKGYRYGGCGPDFFDCSGFVDYCAASVGISLPRTSSEICGAGRQVSILELRPGDIVGRSGHVGIYIGRDQFIHSQDVGSGVVISSLSNYNMHVGFTNYVNIIGD